MSPGVRGKVRGDGVISEDIVGDLEDGRSRAPGGRDPYGLRSARCPRGLLGSSHPARATSRTARGSAAARSPEEVPRVAAAVLPVATDVQETIANTGIDEEWHSARPETRFEAPGPVVGVTDPDASGGTA